MSKPDLLAGAYQDPMRSMGLVEDEIDSAESGGFLCRWSRCIRAPTCRVLFYGRRLTKSLYESGRFNTRQLLQCESILVTFGGFVFAWSVPVTKLGR